METALTKKELIEIININRDNAFLYYCEKGNIKFVKLLYFANANIKQGFLLSCIKNHIEVAQWLYSLGADIHANNLFGWCCKKGNIEIAQWLYLLGANVHLDDDYTFILSCENGHLPIAQWLYSIGAFKDINYALIVSCENGHLPIAQWLYSLGANIHKDNERAFIVSCESGHLSIAQWLYLSGANIHSDNDNAIALSCCRGHIKVVKWLYELGAHIYNDDFKNVCKNRHIELAQWLCSIHENYNITIAANEINYTITEWYDKMSTADIIKKLKINAAANITAPVDICLICRGNSNIKLQCGHFLCVGCMIDWYIKNANTLKCIYCAAPLEYKKMIFYSAVTKYIKS